jgi:hypothetical protein
MRWPSKREWVLLAFVPALLLAGARAGKDGGDGATSVVEARPAAKERRESREVAHAVALDLERLRRDARAVKPQDAFASRSWYVPPPPAPPPPPVKREPATPSAPPFPFTYLGRYAESGDTVYFLVKEDRILTVRPGDVLDGGYRVEGITGSKLGLTYVPLDIRHDLDTETAR